MATIFSKCPACRSSQHHRYATSLASKRIVRWESGSHHPTPTAGAAAAFSRPTPTPAPFPPGTRRFIQRRDVPAPHNGVIRVLTLHSPENRNALSRQMVAELAGETAACTAQNRRAGVRLVRRARAKGTGLDEVDGGDQREEKSVLGGKEGREEEDTAASLVRAVVIASGIDKVFCAGADLKERGKMSEGETLLFLSRLRETFDHIANSSVPVIAAVSGFALGGGLELALAASFRVFGSRAVVGLPETRLGIVPGAGGLFRLRDLIGTTRAADMILTGRRVSAEEAEQMGICQRLVQTSDSSVEGEEREIVINAAIDMATDIAMGAPKATAAATKFFRVQDRNSDREAEEEAYNSVLKTSDRLEALEAFQEKRKAVFKGV